MSDVIDNIIGTVTILGEFDAHAVYKAPSDQFTGEGNQITLRNQQTCYKSLSVLIDMNLFR